MTNVPTEFIDDDAGYLAWLRQHPSGFVVNCERSPRPAYLVLHRASYTINGTPARGRVWTRDYKKVCADGAGELEHWAGWTAGGRVSRCGICQP